MLINADFSKRALVIPTDQDWVDSPAHGVERLMLDRVGDEVARATSLVRYAPDSAFDRHVHAKGEEFLVLQGVFSDEHGDYPPGTYVRNPPGSGHAPFSRDGCTIFVKLRQFDPQDLQPVVVDTSDTSCWPKQSDVIVLHEFASERVVMRRIPSAQQLQIGADERGAELFVFQGELDLDGTRLVTNAWLRLPPGDGVSLTAKEDSMVLLKTGHLAAS
jgi:anti-sigma factor ChrR (cupin superfamily)